MAVHLLLAPHGETILAHDVADIGGKGRLNR